jgi:hypothetical protein
MVVSIEEAAMERERLTAKAEMESGDGGQASTPTSAQKAA